MNQRKRSKPENSTEKGYVLSNADRSKKAICQEQNSIAKSTDTICLENNSARSILSK